METAKGRKTAQLGKPELWWVAGGLEGTNLRVKNSKETESYEDSCDIVKFVSRYMNKFPQQILKKNPLPLLAGEEKKKPFWNTPEHSVLGHKAYPKGKLVN